MSSDFIFRGPVVDVDPELKNLLDLEDDRQDSTIILVASESASPDAVREVMSSKFANVYAEGYPRENSRHYLAGRTDWSGRSRWAGIGHC